MADDDGTNDGMNDGDGTPQDIDAKVAEAVEAAVAGLRAKNAELMGKVKTANTALKAFDGIDAATLREKLDELEDLKTDGGDKGDGTGVSATDKALERAGRKHQRELDAMRTELAELAHARDAAVADAQQFLVNSAISAGMPKIGPNGVGTPFHEAVTLMHRGEITRRLGDEADVTPDVVERVVMAVLGEWSKTDGAKHFLAAPVNQGGGARGGNGGGNLPDEARFFDPKSPDWNMTEQGQVFRRDPELHERMVKQFGDGRPATNGAL